MSLQVVCRWAVPNQRYMAPGHLSNDFCVGTLLQIKMEVESSTVETAMLSLWDPLRGFDANFGKGTWRLMGVGDCL